MIRGVRARILAATAVGAVACATMAVIFIGITVTTLVGYRVSDLASLVGPAALAQCEADPTRWFMEDGVHRVWAYDSALRSSNPMAPEVPSGLRSPVWDRSIKRPLPDGPFWRRGATQRVADDGPCAVVFAYPLFLPPRLPLLRMSSLFGAFVGMVLALMAAMGLAVRPLIARIEALDARAGLVGHDDYASADDPEDDEIGRVSETLDRAHTRIREDRAELQRRHGILEAHLAGLAHDLRTPLASLQLTLEGLAEGLDGAPAQELRVARREVAYLEQLADNLHQASRLRGGLDVHTGGPVDLCAMIERVGLRFGILGRTMDTEVGVATPETPRWAACAPALAERAIANLVHNAVIHGGDQVGLVLDDVPGGFRITLQDNGSGVAPEAAAALADRRLAPDVADDARSRQGPGLGVAIANEVAARAGWTLRYEVSETGGLRVVVEGPYAPSA